MTDIFFKRTLILLVTLLLSFAVMALSPRVNLETPAAKADAAKIDTQAEQLLKQIEQIKQEQNAWCQANKTFIQEGLHHALLKIDDVYQGSVPITKATVSYEFWKTLNETMRRGAYRAIRCQSQHGIIRIFDANGVALD